MTARFGGCLCGAVRYEVDGPLAPVQLCHCGQCRKAQGSAFAANVPVPTMAFHLVKGDGALREYRASPGKRRVFCGDCGSPIFSQRDDAPDVVRLRVGGLDDDRGMEIGFHIQAAFKASWHPIDDDRPAYPGPAPV